MPKSAEAKNTKSLPTDTSRGDFVHGWLLGAIRDGQFQPGSRIREAEVALQLGVSRTPVREAFRRLQAMGCWC